MESQVTVESSVSGVKVPIGAFKMSASSSRSSEDVIIISN